MATIDLATMPTPAEHTPIKKAAAGPTEHTPPAKAPQHTPIDAAHGRVAAGTPHELKAAGNEAIAHDPVRAAHMYTLGIDLALGRGRAAAELSAAEVQAVAVAARALARSQPDGISKPKKKRDRKGRNNREMSATAPPRAPLGALPDNGGAAGGSATPQ